MEAHGRRIHSRISHGDDARFSHQGASLPMRCKSWIHGMAWLRASDDDQHCHLVRWWEEMDGNKNHNIIDLSTHRTDGDRIYPEYLVIYIRSLSISRPAQSHCRETYSRCTTEEDNSDGSRGMKKRYNRLSTFKYQWTSSLGYWIIAPTPPIRSSVSKSNYLLLFWFWKIDWLNHSTSYKVRVSESDS